MVEKISPDIIYCSGWTDKVYLKICGIYKSKIPTVIGLDNQWKGNIKQRIACLISPFYLLKKFSYAWIPGILQYKFAEKLGFNKNRIMSGLYCADVELFYTQFLSNREDKQRMFPKRFIFIGRYYEFKGVKDLWHAFIELQNENPNGWELWCLGTGDIPPIQHPKIKHFGFVQLEQLKHFIKDTGVFILPSHFEPWGVAVHECAAAGMPLICSNEVGAATAFLKIGDNGYLHEAKNINSLKSAMKKMMRLPDKELNKMGDRSSELAKQITPTIWANTIMKIINNQ